jgi:inositol-phosphate phosphatase / L-galactose 1-phosphate phosphatase / histidinol-phosphatase
MPFAEHPDFPKALQLSVQLADTARGIARQYFREPLVVERKADHSPVTRVDRAIETEMRRMIRAAFPAHGIQGEEFAAEPGGEFTWVLDPIDGTKSYISGFPLFGSLIALRRGEQAVLGIIEAPALNERWIGCEGQPTQFNGRVVGTSNCRTLAGACVYTTTTDSYSPDERRHFDALCAQAGMRRFGGDCYLYGMLACGYCDLVIEVGLKPHDYLALIPVVEGAGGRISDWRGAPLGAGCQGLVLAAANEPLWRQAIEALA